ncbi:MAG TPA: hypothetical protein VGJ29_08925 [Vicinamibacterales bacterium]|jgi:hypothetical protein
MSALETKIDDLYSRPLSEFTSARNALAKTLSGADAARVKALAKPAIVPWAINQVYWHARPVYERLLKAGERLRHAQIAALEGKSADVRSAAAGHRAAIADAVKEAERLAAAVGSHPAADALTRTLESLSLAPKPPADPGRLTEMLQPSGFEALAGIGIATHPKLEGKRQKEKVRPDEKAQRHQGDALKEERAQQAREAAAARAREAEIKKAEAALARAQAAERLAHDGWLRAQREVDEIRQRLVRAKSDR